MAAFKGGSPDLPTSAEPGREVRHNDSGQEHGVEIVDSIDALLAKVDVVLLESVDGRPHLAQVTPVLKAGKRVFIDKPLAASLEDARRIVGSVEEDRDAVLQRFVGPVSPGHRPAARRTPASARSTKVQANYTLNTLASIPTCSTTASTASRRCMP